MSTRPGTATALVVVDMQVGVVANAWEPAPVEAVIHKRYNSAFEETALLALLDERHVSHLVLAGAATNACIRATAYAALDRGFDLTLVADAHTTDDFAAASGRTVRAESVIDDLDVAMQWLSYPNRTNVATPAADVAFAA